MLSPGYSRLAPQIQVPSEHELTHHVHWTRNWAQRYRELSIRHSFVCRLPVRPDFYSAIAQLIEIKMEAGILDRYS